MRYRLRSLLIVLAIVAVVCIVLWAGSARLYLLAWLAVMAGAVWAWIDAGRTFRKG